MFHLPHMLITVHHRVWCWPSQEISAANSMGTVIADCYNANIKSGESNAVMVVDGLFDNYGNRIPATSTLRTNFVRDFVLLDLQTFGRIDISLVLIGNKGFGVFATFYTAKQYSLQALYQNQTVHVHARDRCVRAPGFIAFKGYSITAHC